MSKKAPAVAARASAIIRRFAESNRTVTPEMEAALTRMQSSAISLSADISEFVGMLKRLDPEYATWIEEIENARPDEDDGT